VSGALAASRSVVKGCFDVGERARAIKTRAKFSGAGAVIDAFFFFHTENLGKDGVVPAKLALALGVCVWYRIRETELLSLSLARGTLTLLEYW
jgi:hypothetical protein